MAQHCFWYNEGTEVSRLPELPYTFLEVHTLMSRNTLKVIVSVVAAATVMACSPIYAADKPTLGKVDLGKIEQSYTKVQAWNQDLQALQKTLQNKITLKNANRLLTDAEMTELLTLTEKKPQTDADKTKIGQLEEISKQRDSQLNDLSAKQNASEQEQATLKELMERNKQADATLGQMNQDFTKQLNDKRMELTKKFNEDVLAAIKAVAEAKGLTAVVDQQAVLFGGADITDDVVKRLNK